MSFHIKILVNMDIWSPYRCWMQVSITVLMSGALCQCTLSKELLL